ncbi:cell surface protein [Nordella sp. HKS 07]|uniref:glycosyltransferase family 32 protein n=1 Tax=Nordella sp. HKS 07 TaxID=2712222 RepID=UPI0013E1E965|nr:glycosyltransferase [Nordella sp. HKS 07]QIG46465.1 cell surface protein [Nordella sp. HKS 07]
MTVTDGGSRLIPKRIFQTWKSKTELPANFAYWRSSFLDKNPGYQFDLWDDADNRAFIARYFPWFLMTYDAYPAEIYRADMVRYFYLYVFGGFYADLDTQCLKPLDQVLDRGGVLLGRMKTEPASVHHSIPNAIMASTPREEFWLYVIAYAAALSEQLVRPEEITGPVLLRKALLAYGGGRPRPADVIGEMRRLLRHDLHPKPGWSAIHVLQPEEWYPVSWDDEQGQAIRKSILRGDLLSPSQAGELFPSSSLVTYWTGSWFVGPHLRSST